MKPGQLIQNRYHLKKLLGKGGFGHTFLAEDRGRFNQAIALKWLKHEQGPANDDLVRQMFEQEARQLWALGDVCSVVPKLYTFGSEGRDQFLVMDFISGKPLDQEIKVGAPWSEPHVWQLLADVLTAVAAVHAYRPGKIIHRDLKPENLIRRPDRTIAIVDFGAVKAISSGANLGNGQPFTKMVGTEGYNPPEQKCGRPCQASDVYAVGMIALAALTGQRAEALAQATNAAGQVPWRDHAHQSISPALADLLDRFTGSEPHERPENAIVARQELQRVCPASVRFDSPGPRPGSGSLVDTVARSTQRLTQSASRLATLVVVRLFPLASQQPQGRRWPRRQVLMWGAGALGAAAAVVAARWPNSQDETEPQADRQRSRSFDTFSADVVRLDRAGKEVDRSPPPQPFPRCQQTIVPGVLLELVKIPGSAGPVRLGSRKGETGRDNDEAPRTKAIGEFWLGRYPITQGQWRAVAEHLPRVKIDLKPNPAHFSAPSQATSWPGQVMAWLQPKAHPKAQQGSSDDLPVENITWYESMEFCDRLARATQLSFRLPTENEWEYACRAGTTTAFHFGETITGAVANYNATGRSTQEATDNVQGAPRVVGSFQIANGFGLSDMHGNINEWCATARPDRQNNRAIRGGSWNAPAAGCRSAFRNHQPPNQASSGIGFRIACNPWVRA